MAELVKVLTETSLDNLFVLAGLAFSALAVLGNVSGKFEMGKNGRIIAGLLGPCLIAGGLWMHSDHGLRITSLGIVTQKTAFNGPCPVRIPLQGVIDGTGTGAAIYTFELSDGTETPAVRLEFARSDSKLVDGVWEVSSSLNNGWARLKTLAPHEELSKEQASFTVNCGQARGSDATVSTIPKTAGSENSPTASTPVPSRSPEAAAPPQASPATEPAPADSVQITSISPRPGTPLPRGKPLTLAVLVRYNLVSTDKAILALSVAEIPETAGGCSGTGGELSDAAQVPISRGQHDIQIPLTWSGDTGAATKGRVYGKGYIAIVPSFWAENNERRGERIRFFGTYPDSCYPFGP